MADETVSSDDKNLGYTGCEVYRAKRIRKENAVKKQGTFYQ